MATSTLATIKVTVVGGVPGSGKSLHAEVYLAIQQES